MRWRLTWKFVKWNSVVGTSGGCLHLGNLWTDTQATKLSMCGTDKKGTHQNIHLAGSEFNRGKNLSHQQCRESESMERKKYTLSQDEGTSPDMGIPSPQPVDKSKNVAEQVPVKKKSIMVEEYHAREECRRVE